MDSYRVRCIGGHEMTINATTWEEAADRATRSGFYPDSIDLMDYLEMPVGIAESSAVEQKENATA